MKDFPVLKDKEFAVIIADGKTGHVLNCEGKIYRGSSKDEVYWFFDSLTAAKEFIKTRSELDTTVEFLIYNKNKEIVEFIKAADSGR